MRFADTTLLDAAINGTASEITVAYSALATGETFEIVAHSVFLPRPRISVSGPEGIQVTFDWQAAQDPVLGRMCTATLVNDVAAY